MHRSFFDRLTDRLNSKTMIAITIVFVLVSYYALGVFEPYLKSVANGNGHAEQVVVYSPDKLYSIADSYGEQGRALYVNTWMMVDTINPLAYGAFFGGFALYLGKKLPKRKLSNALVGGAQLAGMILDFLENAFCVAFMAAFPEKLNGVVILATVSSTLKTAINCLVILLVFVRLMELLVYKVRTRK